MSIEALHKEMIEKIILYGYPLVHKQVKDKLKYDETIICPVLLGGAAYQVHMIKRNQYNPAFKTDDLDLKIVLDSNDNRDLVKARKVRALYIQYMFDLLEFYKKYDVSFGKMFANQFLGFQVFDADGVKYITTESEFQQFLTYIKSDHVYYRTFFERIDLVSVSIMYKNKQVYGFIDVAIVTKHFNPVVFDLYERVKRIMYPSNITLEFDFNGANKRIEMCKLRDDYDAPIASYDYIVMDTVRMLCNARNPNATYSDLKKYTKNFEKFYHLMKMNPFNQLKLERLSKALHNLKKKIQLTRFQTHEQVVRWLHNIVTQIEIEHDINLLSYWTTNDDMVQNLVLIKELTSYHHVAGGGGGNDNDPTFHDILNDFCTSLANMLTDETKYIAREIPFVTIVL